MIEICQTCGSNGFDVALIYCEKCQTYPIHRYCLKELPKTFDEYVIWYCEDCEPTVETKREVNLKKRKPARKSMKKRSKKRRKAVTNSETPPPPPRVIEMHDSGDCEGSQDKTLAPEAQPEEKVEKRMPARKSNKRKKDISGSKTTTLPIQEIEVEDKDNCGDTEVGSETTTLPIPANEVEGRDKYGDKEVGSEPTTLSIRVNEVEGRDNCGDTEVGSETTTLPIQVNEVEGRDNCGDTEVGSETTTLPIQVNEVEGRDNYGDKEVGSEPTTVPIQVIEVQDRDNCGDTEVRGSQERMLLPETQPQEVSKKRKLPKKSKKKKSKKRKKDAPSSETTTPLQVIEVHDWDNCGDTWLGGSQEKTLPLENGAYTKKGQESAKTSELVASNDPSNLLQLDCNVAAQPIIDPIWGGSLSFWNDEFDVVEGLVAHLSCLACFKVYMQAKLLPDLLSTELLPRRDVWPKGFEKWGPGDQSIALYFFPGNEGYGKVFDVLVDTMICKDLAMRGTVENAELLIFTSTALPMRYWSKSRFDSMEFDFLSLNFCISYRGTSGYTEFGGKSYLWGVFRGKQTSNTLTSGEGKDAPVKALNKCSRGPVSPLSNSPSSLTSQRSHQSL